MTSAAALNKAIDQAYRTEYSQVLATLIGWLHDFELAEDALHDAWVKALEVWPASGIPRNPGAWLLTAARRKAIDRLRRAQAGAQKMTLLAAALDEAAADSIDTMDDRPIPDERLKLIFTCCHPALAAETQVALTLQALGGLTAAEIARAFLTSEATMAQRLVRAKRKIRDAAIPYYVPPAGLIAERVASVLTVIYLIFNEGYAASDGAELIRHELCQEAIRLGYELLDLMQAEQAKIPVVGRAEVAGLLALMVLHHSRRRARISAGGDVIVLEEQDRTLWERSEIDAGQKLLDWAMSLRCPGPYQIQAAISAVHVSAATADATDWVQIVALYDALLRYQDSAVVRLNRIVAIAMADGPWRALPLLDELARTEALHDYCPFYAARADLLRRAGRLAEASIAYAEAARRSNNPGERAYFLRRQGETAAAAT